MDSFYMTLPSNVNTKRKNVIANYVTDLSKEVSLSDGWEVGLSEISYTKSWYNIKNQKLIILFLLEFDPTNNYTFDIPSGSYENIEDLIEFVNQILANQLRHLRASGKPFGKFPELFIDKYSRKCYIKQGYCVYDRDNKFFYDIQKEHLNLNVDLEFTEELRTIFGFSKNHLQTSKVAQQLPIYDNDGKIMRNVDVADYPVEMKGGYHTLFVYCDIVKPMAVGDTTVQLLKTVEVPNTAKFSDQCNIVYDNPMYLPVHLKNFKTIEIKIQDDNGKIIPFTFGRVIVTLHFRKSINKLV